MKKMFVVAIAIFSSVLVMAQPPKGTAKKGATYGDKVTAKGAVDINDAVDKITGSTPTNVKVKGKVVEVCTEQGCWLKMETASGKMMVKMKDHAFFVPLSLNGKEIVVDGIAKKTITPASELQHYAKDAGKSKEEIAGIKDDKKEVVLTAKGILVL